MTYLLRATESGEILDRDGKVVGRVVPVEPTKVQVAAGTNKAINLYDADKPLMLLVYESYRTMLSAATPDIAALAVEMPERYENVTNLGGFRAGFNTALDVLEGK